MKLIVLAIPLFLGCTDSVKTDTSSNDLCSGIELPECPAECPEDYTSTCGEECETEGEECGNDIGDGRICTNGIWQCSVHSPLEPDQCNLVCQ